MTRAAVLGSPVRHSLSPLLHRAAYDVLGLEDWRYDAYDVDAAALPGFLAGLDEEWAGLSLTMPLKAAVLPLLDSASPTVEAVAAANTVLLRDGLRAGENTDVPGMAAALRDVAPVEHAVVLGGGATARSAVAALATRTGSVRAYLRDPARRADLDAAAAASGVALDVAPWPDAMAGGLAAPLVVSTVPAGAADHLAGAVPARAGVLLDVLYDPWPTPLAAAWAGRGGRVVDGLELLVQQAVRQVALMTGVDVDPDGLADHLRRTGERALRR